MATLLETMTSCANSGALRNTDRGSLSDPPVMLVESLTEHERRDENSLTADDGVLGSSASGFTNKIKELIDIRPHE